MAVTTTIPRLYVIFFTTIDPLIALSGILTTIFSPHTILTLYNPRAKLPPSIETSTLLYITSSFYLSTIFLQVVLLTLQRDDLTVWKCLQSSILIQDLGILAAVGRSLRVQGRMDAALLTAEEWGNIAILGAVGLIRVLFIAGLGLRKVNVPQDKAKGA
jgi:hypothetical protein